MAGAVLSPFGAAHLFFLLQVDNFDNRATQMEIRGIKCHYMMLSYVYGKVWIFK